MHFLWICSILLLCANFGFSVNFCLSENPCKCVLPNNTVIDLSSVGSPEHPRFYELALSSNCSELYAYNPCYPFISPDRYTFTESSNEPCAGASACVKSFGGAGGNPPEEHAIGLQHTAVFGIDKDHIYINYTVPKSSKTLQVYLQCINESSADIHELSMEVPKCSNDSGLIVFTLSTKCACPNGCLSTPSKDPSSSGLSTGSKLLIAFFTILLAYLLIGIVWNYCNGSQGMELLPNIEFWNDLPTLIMEGVVFTCSCCGRQSSYGEV